MPKIRITTLLMSGVHACVLIVIKALKRQAYGYKDMAYFALKILQKCGYLNSKYHGPYFLLFRAPTKKVKNE